MLNFLIISDTHKNEYLLRRLLGENRCLDGIFFLGDGLDEVEAVFAEGGLPPLFAVRGNCDGDFSYYRRPREEECLLSFGGHKLLLLHGHSVGVKLSLAGLRSRAAAYAADIVLFGHTHLPEEHYYPKEDGGPLWLFNPGSLGRPQDGRPRFGRLALDTRGNVLFSHGILGDKK